MDYGNRNVHITLSLYPNVSNISSNAKIADIQVHKNNNLKAGRGHVIAVENEAILLLTHSNDSYI